MTANPTQVPEPSARELFLAQLGPRVEALRDGLSALVAEPAPEEDRGQLLRRARGMGLAARSLGFDDIGARLDELERLLRQSAAQGRLDDETLDRLAAGLDDLGLLAHLSLPEGLLSDQLPQVLGYGARRRFDELEADSVALLGVTHCATLEQLERACLQRPPQVAVLEHGAADVLAALELLRARGVPVVVLGRFESDTVRADYAARGATRLLELPVSSQTLTTALAALLGQPASPAPLGQLGELSMRELVERLRQELERALVEDVSDPEQKVALGSGSEIYAPLWRAVARIRELAALRSGGALSFEAGGPTAALGAGELPPSLAGADRGRARPARPSDVLLEGRSVLVVDDDPAVVWFFAAVLRQLGIEVLEAYDGTRALELAEARQPDAILADMLMPGIDGVGLCARLARDVALRDAPILLLSWKDDLPLRARELGVVASGYLRKDASQSVIEARLEEALRPRARVEARLATGQRAEGRLDDVSPYLLLRLLAERKASVDVRLSTGTGLYELALRRGRLLAATRTDAAGQALRAAEVLGPLLGVTTGTFTVEPSEAPTRRDFTAELSVTLAPAIARARDAAAALSPAQLASVRRLALRPSEVSDALGAHPEPARGLVASLLAGERPEELRRRAPEHGALLDLLLADLARRGAVERVEVLAPLAERPSAKEHTAPAAPVALAQQREAELLIVEPSPSPATLTPVSAEPASVAPPSAAPLPQSTAEPPPAAPLAAAPPDDDEPASASWCLLLSESPPPADESPAGPSALAEPAPAAAPSLSPPAVDVHETTLRGLGAPGAVRVGAKIPPVIVRAADRGFDPDAQEPAPMSRPLAASTRSLLEDSPEPLAEAAPPTAPVPRGDSSPPAAYVTDRPPPTRLGPPVTRALSFPKPAAPPRAARPAEEAAPEPAPTAAPRAWLTSARRALRPAALRGGLLIGGAAALSYVAVSALVTAPAAPESVVASSPAPVDPSTLVEATPAASVAPVAEAAAASPSLAVDTLDLPPGVSVPAGMALLEVETGAAHTIYVDDAFVGRGPLRRVVVEPGKHQVRLELGGQQLSEQPELTAGRRTKLSLATAAAP